MCDLFENAFEGITAIEDAYDCFLVALCMYCTVGQKNYPYLFQYKLSYRNETGTNHHGLLSTLV